MLSSDDQALVAAAARRNSDNEFGMYELLDLDEINLYVWRVQWTNVSKKGAESAQEMGKHQVACGD